MTATNPNGPDPDALDPRADASQEAMAAWGQPAEEDAESEADIDGGKVAMSKAKPKK